MSGDSLSWIRGERLRKLVRTRPTRTGPPLLVVTSPQGKRLDVHAVAQGRPKRWPEVSEPPAPSGRLLGQGESEKLQPAVRETCGADLRAPVDEGHSP